MQHGILQSRPAAGGSKVTSGRDKSGRQCSQLPDCQAGPGCCHLSVLTPWAGTDPRYLVYSPYQYCLPDQKVSWVVAVINRSVKTDRVQIFSTDKLLILQ